MSVYGAQRYNFDQLRKQINTELTNDKMPEKLYSSADNIFRIINTIVKTKGKDWTAQVIDKNGNKLFTEDEQKQFTQIFEPYTDTILDFFQDRDKIEDEQIGGLYKPDIPTLSGMSKNFLKTKAKQATHHFGEELSDPTKMIGIDDIYEKLMNRIGSVNYTVNDYASKYGILKLEKEHDLEGDIRLVPEVAAIPISEGVLALSTSAGLPIPPARTQEILSKIKIPFRTIIFGIYLAMDITRVSLGVMGSDMGRKILSIMVSILELLRGDWKKATLTFIGYYGKAPMVFGQVMKVFLSMFKMLSPQIQHNIVFGSLDATKSLIIGLLLSIFQVTAPEEVRLPLIGILEKIAQKKAEMDGTLEDIGLSARPEYLAPTFEDLNNIQAVMSDEAYICSCEFQDLVKEVNKSAIIKIVLQILRIPVTQEFVEFKCGKEPCKPFVTKVVEEAKEQTDAERDVKQPISVSNLEMPVNLSTTNPLTAPSLRGGRRTRVLHSRMIR